MIDLKNYAIVNKKDYVSKKYNNALEKRINERKNKISELNCKLLDSYNKNNVLTEEKATFIRLNQKLKADLTEEEKQHKNKIDHALETYGMYLKTARSNFLNKLIGFPIIFLLGIFAGKLLFSTI